MLCHHHDCDDCAELVREIRAGLALLRNLDRKVHKIMTAQEDLDAVTQDINDRVTELTTATTAIQTEIANLEAQGVDVTNLKAAVAQLDPAVEGVSNLAPATPEPPAEG